MQFLKLEAAIREKVEGYLAGPGLPREGDVTYIRRKIYIRTKTSEWKKNLGDARSEVRIGV
ncbi:hypothetical protein HanPI659440_Chr04g0141341 [Helianthus annuus]|nr:hypothetical protein HanPI659440_Chr04g0141341 [Helianthus annuus]